MLAARIANGDGPTLIHGLRRWFEQIDRASPNSSYRHFAEKVIQPNDTVITFNYDVSLDKELHESVFGKLEMAMVLKLGACPPHRELPF